MPLSPYLFLLCAEILAISVRKNTEIKGITVKETEIKISQYSDDTTLILDGSRSSLLVALKTLDDFGKVSGLKISNKQTSMDRLV